MTALEYARKFVYFWQSTPIAGQFDEARYPFIAEPLARLDDMTVRTQIDYGPSQSLKTILLQIAVAYWLDMHRKSLLAVSQTDDDAKSFAIIKLKPFLERIESLMETLKDDRSAKTIQQMLWASHELIISGPGENAQNSKSVCYLVTDEAHLWCVQYPGALTALTGRMGDRWDRKALHCTTAANAGTEIDILYHKGQQGEWHQRCVHCNELIWPLWQEASRKHYNGAEVFQFTESQSETETLDSIRMVCPHCDKVIEDTKRNRLDMDEGAQYVTMNDGADRETASYRWNCFAPRWKSWRGLLSVYLNAIASAKLGELKPYEEWVKKFEVRSWEGQYPMLGDSTRSKDYKVSELELLPDEIRICTFDVQEGKQGEGFHIWGKVGQWKKNGNSKRIAYERLATWEDARAFQLKHSVPDKFTACDCGARAREVFLYCEKFHWLALKSGDEEGFAHAVMNPKTHEMVHITLPYSTTRLESCTVGTVAQKDLRIPRGGRVPPGFAISRLWSKPVVYGYLYALKQGNTEKEYGISSDINPLFTEQLHSYIPAEEQDKKTSVVKKTIWKCVKPGKDHAFICSAQELLMALIHGYFPVVQPVEKQAA